MHITRLAEDNDLPHILPMVHALAAHHGDPQVLTLEQLRRDTGGVSPWVTLIVALQGGVITGYAALCPLMQLQYGARGMDIHHLFVTPQMRGQGVGRALIEACRRLAKLRGCAYVTVGTDPRNATAAAIYRAAGFDDLPVSGERFRLRI